MEKSKVAVNFTNLKKYHNIAPFNPPEKYPECQSNSLDTDNMIYHGIRNTFYQLGLDRENFNTKEWNPLKEVIEPGMTVFIKPNTVCHFHDDGKDIFSVITHASILRPILDYIRIALKNEGKIIIGDSHDIYANHDKTMEISQIKDMLDWYQNQTSIPIENYDLRLYPFSQTQFYARWNQKRVEQDPRGYKLINIGSRSSLKGLDPTRFRIRIPNVNYKNTIKHHSNGKHEYLLPNSFLKSDAIISVAKLKTHRYAGVSLALKNFMGLPSWKDTLPHYQTRSINERGDEYLSPSLWKKINTILYDRMQASPYLPIKILYDFMEKLMRHFFRNLPSYDYIFGAEWYGNDTVWRTLIDLNKIALYADKDGNICNTPQRNVFYLIDGIVGMEGDGPLTGDPVYPGVILAGLNAPALDAVAATLIGFDFNKIKLIKNSLKEINPPNPLYSGKPDDIQVIVGEELIGLSEFHKKYNLKFESHHGWKKHIELD